MQQMQQTQKSAFPARMSGLFVASVLQNAVFCCKISVFCCKSAFDDAAGKRYFATKRGCFATKCNKMQQDSTVLQQRKRFIYNI